MQQSPPPLVSVSSSSKATCTQSLSALGQPSRGQRGAGAHDYESIVEAAVVEVEELRAVGGAAAMDARAGLARHPALRVCGVGVREGSGSQSGGRRGGRGRTDVVDAEGGQAVPRQPCPQSRTPSATFRLLLLPRSKGSMAGRQEEGVPGSPMRSSSMGLMVGLSSSSRSVPRRGGLVSCWLGAFGWGLRTGLSPVEHGGAHALRVAAHAPRVVPLRVGVLPRLHLRIPARPAGQSARAGRVGRC